MRVGVVCPYDMGAFGGVQNQVRLIADSLTRRGLEVVVAAPGDLQEEARFNSLGPSRVVKANDSATPISLRPSVVRRLRTAVADVDVVHVHEPLMPLVSVAARWTGRPLVGTFHADPSRFVRGLYQWFPPLKWHLRGFSALAAVSETARSAVASMADVAIVPNGVRIEGLPDRRRVPGRVAFVGRNDLRKGLDIAIAAIERVRDRVPDAELHVVTPRELATVPDGVVTHPGLDDADKHELLATAEVFVAPNRRGESFGLTVAEGMAAGCAVVASDLAAFRDVLGDAGLYARPEDPDELAIRVVEVLHDAGARARLGGAAAERARRFDIERTVDAYLEMYEAAIDR